MRVISVMILFSLSVPVVPRGTLKNRFRRPKPASRPASQAPIPARTTAVISLNLNSIDPVTRRSLLRDLNCAISSHNKALHAANRSVK